MGWGASAALMTPWDAMAGPFTRADFEKLVPADKKLRPEWVKSLFERGSRTVYRGPDLEKIGMPVGGLCCGQVYLGGDGRLWHWDIFNRHIGTGAEHYANPMKATSPLAQGFALKVVNSSGPQVRAMDRAGWREVTFNGEYPIGTVRYADPDAPVEVTLEAFSPFIPLNVEDSSLPTTVMQFTVRNLTRDRVEGELAGWLENAVCLHSAPVREGVRRNRVVRRGRLLAVEGSAGPAPAPSAPARPDVAFDDFEREGHGDWTATGDAFGQGPVGQSQVPDYQGTLGLQGARGINSHASAPAGDVTARDRATGTLTSRSFTIERHYITCLVGGGSHAGRTCLNLIVEGQVVRSATGANDNRLQPRSLDVRAWEGKLAKLQIVDQESGGWGNIGVDDIVFSDRPRVPLGPLEEAADFGTMGLALLEAGPDDVGLAELPEGEISAGLFGRPDSGTGLATRPFGQRLSGAVARRLAIPAQGEVKVTFLITWCFPNLRMDRLPPGRHYGTRFKSALAVAEYVETHWARLNAETRLWRETWYDSTLPYWFLDRTFLNTSILATSTSFRFGDGRFWGWEGVGCCHGTCGHVWQYAQAMARLFPELERDTRQRVDFGLALQPDGAIFFRAEFNNIPAIDAQAGTVLRALREHQISTDDAWLRRNWPGIQRAVNWLIGKDADGDGIIEGNQHNTLDTDWFGPVAWLSGLYQAALRAAEEMAREVGDPPFAQKCRAIFERGQRKLVELLFDGDYFINRPDPAHLDAINSGTGCHIDQVFGQSWAWQVGLGRTLPEKETLTALRALWRYNFTPDVGPYRDAYKPGRWYAMPGEAGLLMCTFPREGWDYAQAKGKGADWAAGYFNECMNGFEYQVAGHMIWEGMVQEGLAITRAVHDRYHPARRNPWNEVECGDHYARSMASYGVYLAACGFEYHGPKGHLGFSPRVRPENFRAAFTAAEGWGTLWQKREKAGASIGVEVRWGRLELNTLAFDAPVGAAASSVRATVDKQAVPATVKLAAGQALITFANPLQLKVGQRLEARLAAST